MRGVRPSKNKISGSGIGDPCVLVDVSAFKGYNFLN